MNHADGIGGYITRCKAWAACGMIKDGEDYSGKVVENWADVDCPKCLEKMPKSVKKRLEAQKAKWL